MCKKTIAFISGCSVQTFPAFQESAKTLYLTGSPDNYPRLIFFHKNTPEPQIVDKIKEKKANFVICDGLPGGQITSIQKAVEKKMPTSSPQILHTGINQSIPGVTYVSDHRTAIEQLL